MGYYTYYELEHDDERYDTYNERINHEYGIGKISGYEGPTGPFGCECKWYSWKDDMLKYSKQHPKVTFIIAGEGEESGDMWKCWFRNGRMAESRAKMIFPEPDLSQLDPPKKTSVDCIKVRVDNTHSQTLTIER